MRKIAMIPGVIFGLLFAGAGLFILNQTSIPTWLNWYAMQDWRPAQAELISLSGSDNDTEASYRYEYGGASYQAERVYVAEFKDNIGSYHAELYQRLDRYRRSGQLIPIWVNPLSPHEAVIDRDMRWGLFALMTLFCSIFVGIGLVVIIASVRGAGKLKKSRALSLTELRKEWDKKRKDPDFTDSFLEYSQNRYEEVQESKAEKQENIDWKSHKGWETPEIRSTATKGVWFFWIFAVVWNAISTPLIFVIPDEFHKGNFAVLIAILFPLVGIFLIYKAIASTVEYRHFGRVLFDMDPYPGAIGGHVGGRIEVSRLPYQKAVDASEIWVRLECVYSYVSGSGKNRSRREKIKWAEQGKPLIDSQAQGVNLKFRFDVPDNQPDASVEQKNAYHFWRLTVKVDTSGIDLNRQYNIPVFKTGETSRFVHHDISAQVSAARAKESAQVQSSIASGNFDIDGLSRAMRYSARGSEISMSFPMFRNRLLTVFAAIFAGGFGFATVSMAGMAADGGLFGIFIVLFGLPFFLVALLAAIATIYLLFNNLHVTIDNGKLTILRRLLFIPIFRRTLDRNSISHIFIKNSGSTGQGVKQIKHFKIKIQDKNGRSAAIAEDLDGEDVTEHFAEYLAQRIGVKLKKN